MSVEFVNGYVCHNCTDVAYAQRHIDPQHPKDGPFGVDKPETADHGPAVVLGGALAKPGGNAAAGSTNGVAAVTPSDALEATGRAADRPPGVDLRV